MQGLRVLDLGCGYGWFCRWARENGATGVHGIDVSEKMLARAHDFDKELGPVTGSTSDSITYQRPDLDRVHLPSPNAFDFVYSSLVFHYLADLPRLMDEVCQTLAPGGRFVFSVEHPINTAPTRGAFWRRAEGG